jgi:alpha-1,2-mannosyltransferase
VVAVLLAAGGLLVTARRPPAGTGSAGATSVRPAAIRRSPGWARAGALLLGAAGAGGAVCLPFFAAAPRAMWRMVVLDQLDRPQMRTPLDTRIFQLVGLGHAHPSDVSSVLLLTLLAFGLLVVVALTTQLAQLPVVMLIGLGLLLLVTPTWFLHYGALVSGPLAVTVGTAAGGLVRFALSRHRTAGVMTAAALLGLLGLYAVPDATTRMNTPFPAGAIAARAAGPQSLSTPRCVTSDDETTLIELNLVSRNLEHGCRFVADVSGDTYQQRKAANHGRAADRPWQRYALSYLRSGQLTLVVRFREGRDLSLSSWRIVHHWRVVERVGRFALRHPVAASRS